MKGFGNQQWCKQKQNQRCDNYINFLYHTFKHSHLSFGWLSSRHKKSSMLHDPFSQWTSKIERRESTSFLPWTTPSTSRWRRRWRSQERRQTSQQGSGGKRWGESGRGGVRGRRKGRWKGSWWGPKRQQWRRGIGGDHEHNHRSAKEGRVRLVAAPLYVFFLFLL